MTDKEQIIIDSCKIEECVNFRDEVSIGSTVLKNACSIGLWQRHYKNLEESCKMSCKCDENTNCSFKQLARKTQECEELKDARFNLNCEIYSLNRYRKALEEIEEATKRLKKDLCGHCGWYGTDSCTPSGMVCGELTKILDIIDKAKGR